MEKKIKGIEIQSIIEKYKELGNVWKVGEYFGISGQTIHSELSKLGIIKKMNVFSEEDKQILLNEYESYRIRGELQLLADKLGRTKQFICRKAKELGLTSKVKKYELSEETRRQMSERTKMVIEKYGHPKGMKGKHHSSETKKTLSLRSKTRWEREDYVLRDEEHRKAKSDMMMKMQADGKLGERSRCYMKKVTVGDNTFTVKSSWEFDIALYLEYLKSQGLIQKWEYEPKTFKFKYNTKGVRTYKPDFGVLKRGMIYYIEVKGWEDEKYKIKKELMENEFPMIKIIFIKDKEYRLIRKKYKNKLPQWGSIKLKQ